MGEGARAEGGGRGVDSLRMASVFVVGCALGAECSLDAGGVLRSGAASVSRLEENPCRADRALLPSPRKGARRNLRSREGLDRVISRQPLPTHRPH